MAFMKAMHLHGQRLFLWCAVLGGTFFYVCAKDYISNFESTIAINQNRTLDISEAITWVVPAGLFKHGIFREFPTIYKDRAGNRYTTGFKVKGVLLDGKAIPYKTVSWKNGVVLKIGEPKSFIVPGTHTFLIRYETDHQLGFFKDHDELYFNITGNGWRLPILHTQATIRFEKPIPAHELKTHGYTGYMGEHGSAYTAEINPDGSATFSTTEPINPGQGLTAVVAWPKGYIQPPTVLDKIIRFLHDNLSTLWLIIGYFLLLWFFMRAYRAIKRAIKGVVIPLFYPPKDMLPSTVGALKQFAFGDTAFASEIVNMAVKGLITISQKDGWLSKTYTLSQNEHIQGPIDPLHAQLMAILFRASDSIDLNASNRQTIAQAYRIANAHAMQYLDAYIESHEQTFTTALILALIFIIPGILLSFHYGSVPIALLCVPAYVLLFVIFSHLLKSYTDRGQKIMNEINGFEQFLTVTETERFKVIGTPPTKNPELWETYLPYAMALGVEEQWSKQFTPVFDRLQQEGHPYAPVWFIGRGPFNPQAMPAITSSIRSSLAQSIAASSQVPGSGSGLGGRGSSGGGGGGGGGGSW